MAEFVKKIQFGFFKTYFRAAILLFFIEFCIAFFVHDTIIRPYPGDLLVVILIYCAVKSFINTPIIATASGVLLFSYLVEISQYFHLIKLLGWQNSVLAHLVLGSSYSWIDMLLYTIGFVIIIVFENIRLARTSVLKI